MTIIEGKVLARIKVSNTEEIHIKTFTANEKPFIDARKFVVTNKYTGYTQKGIALSVEQWTEVITCLQKHI